MDVIKVSFNLGKDQFAQLQALATLRGTTATEVLRTALAEAWYFEERRREGDKVLIQKPNGKVWELVPRA